MRLNWTERTAEMDWRDGKNIHPHALSHTLCYSLYYWKGNILQNSALHHHHGNLQLEEEDAVEGMAHGPGEE